MPPSKPACQALATAYRIAGEAVEKLSDIKDAVLRLVKLKSEIRFGLIDIVDAVGAEVIGALSTVSSRVAENVLGSVSKMAAEFFERIFSSLLNILLAFPTSIFSLVAIPHDAAVKATRRESTYLRKADQNLERIVYIIVKWTKGKSGSEYRNQMIEALPYIISAIDLCSDLIHGLKGEPTNPEEGDGNAVFKEGVYQKIRSNLAFAIEVSRPLSEIEQRLEINKRLEDDKKKKFNDKASKIRSEYSERRKELSNWYTEEIKKIKANGSDTVPNRLEGAINEQKILLLYDERLKDLDFWKNESLAIANVKAETESLRNKDTWIEAVTSVNDRFVIDMETLEDQIYDMLENIKNAYTQNKLSQLHCNTVYDIRSLISSLVEDMIAYMRSFGNASAEVLIDGIEGAQSLMEVARDNYQGATNPGLDLSLSASEYSGTLALGHASLISADAVFDSVVTDSLIDIINADDVLSADNDEFNEFVSELAQIPDWDGERGVWAVNMANSSVTPYIQLIADITEMLARLPALSVKNRSDDRQKVKRLLKDVRRDFRRLKTHNSIVTGVLSSYVPYVGSEAGNLMKLLSSAGLLDTFSNTMSVVALVTDLTANFQDNFGSEFPNYKNCKENYPDSFINPNTFTGSVENKLNMQDPKLENSYQATLEESDKDKKIQHLKSELSSTDYTDLENENDKDLLGHESQDPVVT